MKVRLLITSVLFAIISLSNLISAQPIDGGMEHSLAICTNQTVMAWGRNTFGELGNGNNNISKVPVYVNSLTGITAISGGRYHSLALNTNGTVWAWGRNVDGGLGNGTLIDSNIPVQVSNLSGIIVIKGGEEYSVALKDDGTYRQLWNQALLNTEKLYQKKKSHILKIGKNNIGELLQVRIKIHPILSFLKMSLNLFMKTNMNFCLNIILNYCKPFCIFCE